MSTGADLSRLSQTYPNKRSFITGAGSGLGLAFATKLAHCGWKIAITDIDSERLDAAAQKLQSIGGTPTTYLFDVSDYECFRQAVNDFVEKSGGIDIGINNAGVGCSGYLHELPVETFRRVIDINLMGVVHGCHLFIPVMKRQRAGHILNVASAAAFVTAPLMSAYNTSKGGVLSLSETLRAELLEDGVRVTVLMPTYVRTNIGKDSLGKADDNLRAQTIVEQCQLSAEQVAEETFQKMGMGELYVVLPKEARFLWRFKRLMPDRFWRFIGKETKRRIQLLDQNRTRH